MLRTLTIRNFRCFHELAIGPLGRVNLIAGKNNVGKTALLEAVLFHEIPGDPKTATVFNQTRGVDAGVEDPWTWLLLFPETSASPPIEVSTQSDDGDARLRIEFKSDTGVGSSDVGDVPPPADFDVTLAYEGHRGSGSSLLRVEGGVAKIQRAGLGPVPPCRYFPSLRSLNWPFDNQRFSELERAGRQADLLAPLRVLEPRLQRLLLLILAGKPVIHADLGLKVPIPVRAMGEGTGRLLSILLGILTAPRGVILIDEIENGVHYSALSDMWKAIGVAAEKTGVQVFATTHSWECIVAAHQALSGGAADDFRLHRLDRVEGGIKAITWDEESLATAVEMNHEVR